MDLEDTSQIVVSPLWALFLKAFLMEPPPWPQCLLLSLLNYVSVTHTVSMFTPLLAHFLSHPFSLSALPLWIKSFLTAAIYTDLICTFLGFAHTCGESVSPPPVSCPCLSRILCFSQFWVGAWISTGCSAMFPLAPRQNIYKLSYVNVILPTGGISKPGTIAISFSLNYTSASLIWLTTLLQNTTKSYLKKVRQSSDFCIKST